MSISPVALLVAVALSAWMGLEDQFRLQPWMYQFLLAGFALAVCPPGQGMRLCRVFAIALYLHSGLSKLDHEFTHEMGRWFLYHGARVLHLRLASWSDAKAQAIIFAMPCYEIGGGHAAGVPGSPCGDSGGRCSCTWP